MLRLIISAQAEENIEHVLNCTLEKWGEDQVRIYSSLIKGAIIAIRNNPYSGRPRFGVESGLLAFHIGQNGKGASHLFYYRIRSEDSIEIIAFLHERMDPALHL